MASTVMSAPAPTQPDAPVAAPTARRRGKSRYVLRTIAVVYLFFLLILPVGLIFWRTFEHGVGPVITSLTDPAALHAMYLTALIAVIAVIANTIFGVGASVLIVRHRFPGRRLLDALIDLPLAVSPVVVGLALTLVYGLRAPVGSWLAGIGVQIIFSLPGMVLATIFVSMPLVVRAVVPVLEEIGTEQEQSAWTLGSSPLTTFRRITLPSIRWALAYGVVLALARCLGEYGAVAVVSGRIVGQTQTLTLLVEQDFDNFDQAGAFAAAALLAVLAVAILLLIGLLKPKEGQR